MPPGRRARRINKGGRPRSTVPTIDQGTPELIAKRAALGADPILSTCPLDLALSKGVIDRDTHTAAGYFAACRALVFGSPHPKAVDLLRVSGASIIPNTSEAESRYRRACLDLRSAGKGMRDAVETFVVHERFPTWLIADTVDSDRVRLLIGLAILRDWYRGRRRRAA